MPSPYSSKAIANTFIDIAERRGSPKLSPMKIQKLVYFAHGWHLAFYGSPLIRDEIQAWKFGPVVQEVYHEFKEFGNEGIDRKATDLAYEADDLHQVIPVVEEDDESAHYVINQVWEIYSPFTAVQLSNMTHNEGSPWMEISKQFEDELPRNIDIPDELIRRCFIRMKEEGRGA